MPKRAILYAMGSALAILIIGCASQAPAVVQTPAVVKAPAVRVSRLQSLSFTPMLIKFESKIVIQNEMSADLDFQRVDYAVDLYETEMFRDSFDGLKRTRGNGDQTVTFPFHIAMEDVMKQAVDVLAGGSLQVTFRGQVYTAARYGLDPVPFTKTVEIPVPRMPDIAYVGTEGIPFSDSFRIRFQITNTNSFPFTLNSVKTFLVINGNKYSLLHTVKATDLASGETRLVVLQMENSPGKTLSMALNLAQNPHPIFNITGAVTCGTPYGRVFVPVNLEQALR